MRIRFERSGGFAAAMRRAGTFDTETLPDAEAKELRDLVASSGVLDMGGRRVAPSQARDQRGYCLTIEDGGKTHVVEATDTDMPASLRPLIHWLSKHSAPGG
jgi:hypothetical protein